MSPLEDVTKPLSLPAPQDGEIWLHGWEWNSHFAKGGVGSAWMEPFSIWLQLSLQLSFPSITACPSQATEACEAWNPGQPPDASGHLPLHHFRLKKRRGGGRCFLHMVPFFKENPTVHVQGCPHLGYPQANLFLQKQMASEKDAQPGTDSAELYRQTDTHTQPTTHQLKKKER